jgi:WD40 repeat protein
MASLYDAQTDRIIGHYAPSNKESLRPIIRIRAAFSDDGKQMALNNGESIEVTDLSGDYPRHAMKASVKQFWSGTLCFSPDGKRLLCNGYSGAWLFNAESGAVLHNFLETERFADMYRHQNGGIWNSLAGTAMDWAGMVTDRFKNDVKLSACFNGDGRCIVTYAAGQVLRVWDTETCQLLQTIHTNLPEKRNEIGEIKNTITLSEDGQFAFACNGNSYAPGTLWSVYDGKLLRRYTLPESSWLSGVPASDGKALFVISNGDLYRWPGGESN